jgi:hypothetical protein
MSKNLTDYWQRVGMARSTPRTELLMKSWLDIYTAARDKKLAALDTAIKAHIKTSGNKDFKRGEIYARATQAASDDSIDGIIAKLEMHLAGKVKMRKSA